MPQHFTTVGEGGPLGAGRLFTNPNLSTLRRLSEASNDPNRSVQGRRDVSVAFDKFSSFLERQDAKEAQRQFARQQSEAREIALQEKRDEAALRKEITSDPVTRRAMKAARRASLILGGPRNIPAKARERLLPQSLQAPADTGFPVQLTEIIPLPAQEFNERIVQLQREGLTISREQFTAATNANAKNQAGERSQEGLELRKTRDVETTRLNNQRLNLSREREARLSVSAEINAAFKGTADEEASAGFQKRREEAIDRLSKPRLTAEDIEFYEEAAGGDPELATEMAREDGFNVPD